MAKLPSFCRKQQKQKPSGLLDSLLLLLITCCSFKEGEEHGMMYGSLECFPQNLLLVADTLKLSEEETAQHWRKSFRGWFRQDQKFTPTTGVHIETCICMLPTWLCTEQSYTRTTLWIPSLEFIHKRPNQHGHVWSTTLRWRKEYDKGMYKIFWTSRCGGIGEGWMLCS